MRVLSYKELWFIRHAIKDLWEKCEDDGTYTFPDGGWFDQKDIDTLLSILVYEEKR